MSVSVNQPAGASGPRLVTPSPASSLRVLRALRAAGGTAGAAATAVVLGAGDPLPVAAIVAAAFLVTSLALDPLESHARQLPLMCHAKPGLGALLASVALFATGVAALPGAGWTAVGLVLLFAAALAGHLVAAQPLRRAQAAGRSARRIALVGPDALAVALRDELRQSCPAGYELAGRITVGPADPAGHVPALGALDDMGAIVIDHRIDLLVLGPEIPRLPVFDTIAGSCLELPVRLVDLNSFCERVFGHVPVRSINAAWFQYLMHPRFRREASPLKRAVDLAIAGAAAVAFLPILALVAPLIRRDGGPVFFTQTRIGDGGRPFRIFKLRTMRVSDGPSTWTQGSDPRVTRIGALLRRTHLDEVPQLINVLRGEMSIVGPRPEQPGYVASLERDIPFYSRRHLIKPGITGWAQVRCGYAGSVEGSAWKMCHDLYYVKHRSLGLDLLILGETVRTLFADRQFPQDDVATGEVASPILAVAEGAVVSS